MFESIVSNQDIFHEPDFKKELSSLTLRKCDDNIDIVKILFYLSLLFYLFFNIWSTYNNKSVTKKLHA